MTRVTSHLANLAHVFVSPRTLALDTIQVTSLKSCLTPSRPRRRGREGPPPVKWFPGRPLRETSAHLHQAQKAAYGGPSEPVGIQFHRALQTA